MESVIYGLHLPSYLSGCLSVCCVIGLVWVVVVVSEDIWRSRRERALRIEINRMKQKGSDDGV